MTTPCQRRTAVSWHGVGHRPRWALRGSLLSGALLCLRGGLFPATRCSPRFTLGVTWVPSCVGPRQRFGHSCLPLSHLTLPTLTPIPGIHCGTGGNPLNGYAEETRANNLDCKYGTESIRLLNCDHNILAELAGITVPPLHPALLCPVLTPKSPYCVPAPDPGVKVENPAIFGCCRAHRCCSWARCQPQPNLCRPEPSDTTATPNDIRGHLFSPCTTVWHMQTTAWIQESP